MKDKWYREFQTEQAQCKRCMAYGYCSARPNTNNCLYDVYQKERKEDDHCLRS
jgi:hypothetical protein